jgi:hypothetical protein
MLSENKLFKQKPTPIPKLDIVIKACNASIVPGMDVRRILHRLRRMVGPFIFMEHAGPMAIQPAVDSSIACETVAAISYSKLFEYIYTTREYDYNAYKAQGA